MGKIERIQVPTEDGERLARLVREEEANPPCYPLGASLLGKVPLTSVAIRNSRTGGGLLLHLRENGNEAEPTSTSKLIRMMPSISRRFSSAGCVGCSEVLMSSKPKNATRGFTTSVRRGASGE
jgi:hypothetical protein